MHLNELSISITDKLIKLIEEGVGTWQMPWHREPYLLAPTNVVTNKGYRGINVFSLMVEAIDRGYGPGKWGTYKQFQSLDAHVRKGEHGVQVVKFVTMTGGQYVDVDGQIKDNMMLVPKVYTVFHSSQVDGLESVDVDSTFVGIGEDSRLPEIDEWVSNTGATITNNNGRAYYSPSDDIIGMPELGLFSKAESYYSTLAHELVHWTGHSSRLDRGASTVFGSPEYAHEELIAELGSAIACAHLGVRSAMREDHAPYIRSWLSKLSGDPKYLGKVVKQAEQAVAFLNAI